MHCLGKINIEFHHKNFGCIFLDNCQIEAISVRDNPDAVNPISLFVCKGISMSNLIKTNPSGSRGLILNRRRSTPNFFADLFDDFPLTRFYSAPMFSEPLAPQIRINVSDRPHEYFIRADIPGAKKEDIHISVEGNYVTIKAEITSESEEKNEKEQMIHWECSSGAAVRSFQLPGDVNREKAKAAYEDGVLTLTLPKINNGTISEIAIQ